MTTDKINSLKQLWSMPGGTFAKITAVGAAIGLGYGFFKALPMLIAGAANTLIFMGELIAIAAILFLITSKDFWKWLSLLWLQLNRAIVGSLVKIDPISILENGIYELKKKLNVVDENVTRLGGILVDMKKNLEKYQADFEKNVRRRATTQKAMADPGISSEQALELKTNYISINNDIARLEKIITAQKKRINTSEKYLSVMKRLQVLGKFKVKDTESELKYRKEEYEAAKAQTTALKSITAIVNGGLTKSLEEELALNYINETINNSIAEMSSLLDGTNDILVNFDLDSAANIDKVDEILARYEKNGFASFDDVKEPETVPYQNATAGSIGNNSVNDSTNADKVAEPEAIKIPARQYF